MPPEDQGDLRPCPAHIELVTRLNRVLELVENQDRKLDRICAALYGLEGAKEYGHGATGLVGQVDRNTGWILRSSKLLWIGAAALVTCLVRVFWPEGPTR